MRMDKVKYDFSVGSINVRGINDQIKRTAIFNWIKKNNFDICMMQECYCTGEVSSKWQSEWGGKCLFAYGSKHSRGRMILFKQELDVTILSTESDNNGRYIIVEI